MKKLFRYFMLFVFLWGITSQIEAKDKHFIIQGIEYRLSKIVDNLYCAVDNLHPEQMKDSTSLVIPAYVSYKGKSYPVTFCSLNSDVAKNIRYLTIPKTLRIGKHDFRNFTSLLSVSFEDGVERIGDFAFYQLPELHWVDLPNSSTGHSKTWNGIYSGKTIPFKIEDKDFLKQVYANEIKFGSATTIKCTLQIKTKRIIAEDEATVKEENTYIVKSVQTWADDQCFQRDTKRYKKQKADDRQLTLDFDL